MDCKGSKKMILVSSYAIALLMGGFTCGRASPEEAQHRMPHLRPSVGSSSGIPKDMRSGFSSVAYVMRSMDLYSPFNPRNVTECVGGFVCQNSGTCELDTDGNFAGCICDGTGHTGDFCQCEGLEGDDPCEVEGICGIEASGTCVWDCGPQASCSCNEGFMLTVQGKCEDVDECAMDPNICEDVQNSRCENSVGGFVCDCLPGFTEISPGVCQRLCPLGSGWTPFGESCYLATLPSLTPSEASDICHGYGSDLICAVKDTGELTFIGLLSLGSTWLGYNDNGKEGTYVCSYDANDSFEGEAGKPPLTWQNLEPNGVGSENCVSLVHNQWASVDCNEEHNFVCELKNPTEGPCPDGWTPFTSNGAASCYWNPPGKANFGTASQFCKLSVPESDLMIIDSERENDVVASWYGFLQNSGPTFFGYRQGAPGSNDWMWTGQGSPSLFVNWLQGMPTNKPGVSECAVIVPSKMMDVACSKQHNFICKSDVEHQP